MESPSGETIGSQSELEGPRMLPSMYASPGQRVHVPAWEQEEHTVRSLTLIERTSFIWGDWNQMSLNFWRRTFSVGSGNCTRLHGPRQELLRRRLHWN